MMGQTIFKFEKISIKHIDFMALFFTSLARTENKKIQEFLSLKNLSGNDKVFHLRKQNN